MELLTLMVMSHVATIIMLGIVAAGCMWHTVRLYRVMEQTHTIVDSALQLLWAIVQKTRSRGNGGNLWSSDDDEPLAPPPPPRGPPPPQGPAGKVEARAEPAPAQALLAPAQPLPEMMIIADGDPTCYHLWSPLGSNQYFNRDTCRLCNQTRKMRVRR